jgi:phosphoglycerate dehydrogenase-like enzyme
MTALRVIVLSKQGLDALSDAPGLEILITDPGDTSTFPSAADALVAARSTPDECAKLLSSVPGIRHVLIHSAGVDQWIGRLPHNIALVNGRGAHGRATAEWAVTCLLAVRRGLPGFVADQQKRRWAPRLTPGLVGAHVLIIGAGDVGHHIKRRLQAFDAEVTMIGRVERAGVRSVASLDELLPFADAVVLSLPLTPQSRRLVDAHFLAALPDGAVVVNAARGQIIDTVALLAELTAGRLYAALDVTDPDPLPPDHPLWNAPNVLLTPHIGGHTDGTEHRAWSVMRGQLNQIASGTVPSNLVTSDY